MRHNKYSLYYDHIGYILKEYELPADIEVNPKDGVENYEAIAWAINHGIIPLLPVSDWNEDGEALDMDGEPYDEFCVEATLFDDRYDHYVVPLYEMRFMEAGESPYLHTLEENEKGKRRKGGY